MSMFDLALLWIVFALAYLGFALFALSQARHWRQVTALPPPSPRGARCLRIGGSALLIAALLLALWRDGPAFGALLWTVAISACVVAVALTLSARPTLLQPLAHLLGRTARC